MDEDHQNLYSSTTSDHGVIVVYNDENNETINLNKEKKTVIYWRIPCMVSEISNPHNFKIMTYVYNHSISNGIVPTQWKSSDITPVAKIKKSTFSSDYRPRQYYLERSNITLLQNISSLPSYALVTTRTGFRGSICFSANWDRCPRFNTRQCNGTSPIR